MSAVETRATIPDVLDLPEERIEGREKVTGRARYAADVHLPGMLHAAFLRSPFPHARIRSIDTRRARKVKGVRAVITGAEVRPTRMGRTLMDWPVLAWDRVRFIGDRVAAVAADDRGTADRAVREIVVDYEELPAILSAEDALRPGAPVLHPDSGEFRFLRGTRSPVPHPNVQGHGLREHGDVASAFREAARVFEHTFTTPRQHQGFIEPRASVVWLEGDVVRVISTNKAPFALREQMATALGIPEEKIVVDNSFIGGDFGGKGLSVDEYALYFLARATGRPVKVVYRYADELQATNIRHAATIALRTGVAADGRFVAHEAKLLFDGGAYAAGKPVATLLPGDALLTLAGYGVPNARVEATSVYTNTVPAGHARAPGQPQNVFAVESHVDLIARGLGIAPLELRLRNAIRPGEIDVTGHRWERSQAVAVLETLRREARLDEPAQRGRGRGIALGVRHVGRGKGSLVLSLTPDGHVDALTALPDQGGGALTVVQRVIAAELGIELERVSVRRGSTAEALRDAGVGGSRVTPVAGGAALDGARKLRAKLDELEPGWREMKFAVAAARVARDGLRVVGEYDSPEDPGYGVYAYAVEVQVDRDTGQVRVLDVTLVADVGTVINPVAARGQLEGGFVYGFGQSLMEELRVEDGKIANPNLGEYKLPTIADVPPFRLVLLTEEKGHGPFGAKSVGELANPGVGAAVANAIEDAVSVRIASLPLTAEKVFRALNDESRADRA